MQILLELLGRNPWIWTGWIIGLAIWIPAITLVIRSSKFRRKWLWALLCLFSFTYGWSPQPGMMVGVGLPIGAAYVLWFWRFGRAPAPEDIEKDAARRAAQPAPIASPLKLGLLRASYMVAAAATLLTGWLAVSGQLGDLMLGLIKSETGGVPPDFQQFLYGLRFAQGGFTVALAGLFVFLSFRPYWWGKLLCLSAALSWGCSAWSCRPSAGDLSRRCGGSLSLLSACSRRPWFSRRSTPASAARTCAGQRRLNVEVGNDCSGGVVVIAAHAGQ